MASLRERLEEVRRLKATCPGIHFSAGIDGTDAAKVLALLAAATEAVGEIKDRVNEVRDNLLRAIEAIEEE